MTRDTGRPGFLADNVTVLDDDGIGLGILLRKAGALYEDLGGKDGFMLGMLTDDNDDLTPCIGHTSTDLVVTLEANPRVVRVERL